jgi:hypothetical protein
VSDGHESPSNAASQNAGESWLRALAVLVSPTLLGIAMV